MVRTGSLMRWVQADRHIMKARTSAKMETISADAKGRDLERTGSEPRSEHRSLRIF